MRKLKTDSFLSMLQARELTVNAFAQQTGIPQGTLSHYVRGDRNIGPKTLKKLCEALHCDPTDISTLFFKVDKKKLAESKQRENDLVGYFHQLTTVQQERVLRMVQGLADANMAEEELKHG